VKEMGCKTCSDGRLRVCEYHVIKLLVPSKPASPISSSFLLTESYTSAKAGKGRWVHRRSGDRSIKMPGD